MKKELEFWKFASRLLQRNESAVLLVVVESSGSSPGRQGFKMLVSIDELCGSVGGGLMEMNLVETARDFLLQSDSEAEETYGHPIVFAKLQVHQKDRPFSSGMICSGKQTVLFFKLKPTDLRVIESIENSMSANKIGVLKIGNRGIHLVDQETSDFQSIDSSAEIRYEFESKDDRLEFSERIGVRNKLFIIGGGHCALALSNLMSNLNFHISLFDDRPGLNTILKNEGANSMTIVDSYEKIADFVDSGSNNYVVVMTLGYKFDEMVIRRLFDKEFKYFGVLGSRSKMKVLLQALENDGYDKGKLKKIRTPIGVPILSRTPEEIAVSIAAEIILVKNTEG